MISLKVTLVQGKFGVRLAAGNLLKELTSSGNLGWKGNAYLRAMIYF